MSAPAETPGGAAAPAPATDEFDPVDPGARDYAAAPAATSPPPAPKPAAPAPGPDPDAAPKYKHSALLVRLARHAGIPDAEIETTPTEDLREAVAYVRAMQDRDRQVANVGRAAAPGGVSPPAAPTPAPPAEDDDDDDLDEFNPRLVKAIKKAREPGTRVRELEAELKALKDSHLDRERRSAVEVIDAAFDALPPEFAPLVGTGPVAAFTGAQAAERARRAAVYQMANLVAADTPGQVRAKIAHAARTLFGPLAAAAPPTDPAAPPKKVPPKDPATGRFTAEEWERAGLARPTSRAGATEPKGVQAARAAVAEKMRAAGEDPGSIAPTDEYDSLPD